MIQIVFKPEKAPVVKGEALYKAVFNQSEGIFLVRARNAAEAERKTMIVMRHELTGKLIDFNADDFPSYERKDNGEEDKPLPSDDRAEADRAFHEVAPLPPSLV